MAQKPKDAAAVAKNLRKTNRYKNLRQALIDDLENAGINRLPYTDMVEQYMDLWVQLQLLNSDIAERGVQIPYQNGSTQKGVTDNKSMNAAIRVGARMDDILATLGYKDRAKKQSALTSGGGEDDEL